jgi:hypothetical protein
MKSTDAPGNALHTEAGFLIDEDGHKRLLNQESWKAGKNLKKRKRG